MRLGVALDKRNEIQEEQKGKMELLKSILLHHDSKKALETLEAIVNLKL